MLLYQTAPRSLLSRTNDISRRTHGVGACGAAGASLVLWLHAALPGFDPVLDIAFARIFTVLAMRSLGSICFSQRLTVTVIRTYTDSRSWVDVRIRANVGMVSEL